MSPPALDKLRWQIRITTWCAPLLYAATLLIAKYYYRYSFKNLSAFREPLWKKLDEHDGPVIWAANHLTLIDSFLVIGAVIPWHRVFRIKLVPWSTPEYRNYYYLGGAGVRHFIRALMYLCRCIPFLREGEDEASVAWREEVFQQCVGLLRDGGSVFIYPEAGRSRKGWLDPTRPKDFMGRLAMEVPEAKFLCVYLRGESQLCTTAAPIHGEEFRVYAELIPARVPSEQSPRDISTRLFKTLAELQESWFAESSLAKNCGGNDVVDLKCPLIREHFYSESGELSFDVDWLDRHLTPREFEYLNASGDPYKTFWKFFAAKEAAYKAFSQSGIATPSGGFRWLETDLFLRKVVHRPSGAQADILFTDDDDDKIHCLSVLRGGVLGDSDSPGDVLWKVEALPAGRHAGDYARERCLDFIAESNDEISSPGALAFSDLGGVPQILHRGKAQDWGVSISHSGRYVAYSFMIS